MLIRESRKINARWRNLVQRRDKQLFNHDILVITTRIITAVSLPPHSYANRATFHANYVILRSTYVRDFDPAGPLEVLPRSHTRDYERALGPRGVISRFCHMYSDFFFPPPSGESRPQATLFARLSYGKIAISIDTLTFDR